MGAGRRYLTLIACGVACLSAAPASARSTFHPRIANGLGLVPPVNSRGQMVTSTDPAAGASIPLTYHGGQVMTGPVTVHTVFWAPAGYAFQGSPGAGIPSYKGMIQQFFTDVAHDSGAAGTCTSNECNAFTTLPQFGQGTSVGAVTPGSDSIQYAAGSDSIDDTNGYPAASAQCASPGGASTCITDTELETEIDQIVQSTPGSPRGLGNLWFVFLPPGVDECLGPGECGTSAFAGYHSEFNVNGHGVTIYALSIDPIIEGVIGHGSDPEGYPDAEAAIDIAAHETVEASTDPEGAGWMDPDGSEAGDRCVDTSEQTGTPLGFSNGSPYNQVINGHPYLLQEMWANLSSGGPPGCVQSTTNRSVELPLPQVNLRQFNPVLTGNVNRAAGGGIGVRVSLVRPDENGDPEVVARASTTTAANGTWSVSLAQHAVGDDRDEIDVDYSGAAAPQPNHQVILTGNGGNPYTEAGWTGWFDMDNGTLAGTSSLTVAPCFQSGVLGFSFDGAPGGQSPTDFCNLQSDAATVGTARITPSDVLTATSNDNRAFHDPNSSTPNPLGGLVSLTVPVGEVGSVSPFTSPLDPLFTPGGVPSCLADLEFQAVLCDGLRPGAAYTLLDGRQRVSADTDSTGTLVSPLHLAGGDEVMLSNGVRTLSALHVAHLRVRIVGEQDSVAAGSCEPGDYWGGPLSNFPVNGAAGVATNSVTGGVALTGAVCPDKGDASGMPTDAISQTDDLSGGQTETEVPDIENTSPMEGETMYGRFTALAESGLSAPGNTTFPTDLSTQIALRIVTANSQRRVFSARNVDTAGGVAVPALKPASYLAIWTLVNSNGDERLMATRFVEQLGRAGPAPRAKVLCAYTSSLHNRIGCRVSFAKRARVKGKVRVRLSRGGVIVGLGHARLHHGRAGVTLHVLRRVRSGGWRATVVLARTHLAAVTQTVRLAGVS